MKRSFGRIGFAALLGMLLCLPASAGRLSAQLAYDSNIVTQNLSQGATPTQLVQDLVGSGVSFSNVTYTGASVAAGTFTATSPSIIGFSDGVVLSSGCINNVIGPPVSYPPDCQNNQPGDPDLTALTAIVDQCANPPCSANPTYDASVLQFDFVPTSSLIAFQYTFASEEYNQFANGEFNDVFGFWVNGANCALVPGTNLPVSVNSINGGNPLGTLAQNPQFYRNNQLFDSSGNIIPGDIDTKMNGLTTVLTCVANVTPNATNHVKLGIANTEDQFYDSNVFLQAQSFTTAGTGAAVPTTLTYTGDTVITNGGTAHASGLLTTTSGSAPVVGRTVTFFLGSGSGAQGCYGITNGSGIASCSIPVISQPLGAGSIAASFSGDSTYGSSTGSAPVTINSTASTGGADTTTLIYSGDSADLYSHTATFSAQLFDTSKSPATSLSGQTISFTQNGLACSGTTNASGTATCTVTLPATEPAGSYSVAASFAGTTTGTPLYQASSTTAPFTVNPDPTAVSSVGPSSIADGAAATLSAVLKTQDTSTAIVGRTLTLTLGSGATAQSCTTSPTDSTGTASCAIATIQQPAGANTITANFAGDDDYGPSFATAPANVTGTIGGLRATSLLYNGAVSAEYNDSATLSAILDDTSSATPSPISGAMVALTLGSGSSQQSCSGTTSSNGTASCSVTVTQPAGNYLVSASYAGTSQYAANSASAPFTIAADLSTLGYTGATTIANGSATTLSALLLEDGDPSLPVAGGTITLTLGSGSAQQVCTGVTNASGIASCLIPFVSQPLGAASISANFAGNGDFVPSYALATATISAGTGNSTPPPASNLNLSATSPIQYGSNTNLSAKLSSGSGTSATPIANATVTFTLGNGTSQQSCSNTTDSTGTATCSIAPIESPGSYTVVATFDGSTSYLGSAASAPLVITKVPTTLNYTGDTTIAQGGSAHLSAVLLANGTAPIAGRLVSLTIGSGSSAQSCSATTDGSGTASCTIGSVTQSIGGGSISASFAGDIDYAASTASASANVITKATPAVTLTSTDTTNPSLPANSSTVGDSVTFTAAVSGSGPAPTGSIQFVIDGQNTGPAVGLDGSGHATYTTAGLNPAHHPVLASYSGDANYLPGSATLTQVVSYPAPVVTAVNPANGPITGGTVVTITGTNLNPVAGSSTVKFGASAATNVSCNSAGTSCTATSPAGSAGAVDVTVTTPGGASATSSADRFTYIAAGCVVCVMNPTADKALRVTGNGGVTVSNGAIVVNSNDEQAATLTGNASVTDTDTALTTPIGIVGPGNGTACTKVTGNGSFSPKATCGITPVLDPLAGLAVPSLTGANQSSVTVADKSSKTINPGVYTDIQVTGNGTLTLNPGVYVLTGGDHALALTGNGSIRGSGVTLYFACSSQGTGGSEDARSGNIPQHDDGGDGGTANAAPVPCKPGQKGAGLSLTGNGSFQLTAPTSGAYQGIVIFYDRNNAQDLSLTGNGSDSLTGTIYARSSEATLTGNGGVLQLNASVIVDTLTLTGNGAIAIGPGAVLPSTGH